MRPDMSKQMQIAARVKRLEIGKSFFVETETERQEALRSAKVLKKAGAIAFDVVTRTEGNGFKIAAI